ncbi:MAG: DUF6242 domain-containing protein [Tannerella sp.]|nr:DUF6242 domain-containing protein [Tannerella sp.]
MKSFKLQFWLMGCLAFLISSCLGDDNEKYDDMYYSNCQIKSFSLSNDSIAGLSNVKFTIDQVSGLIYNKDSMPYGTVIDRKVVCKIEYVVSPLKVEIHQAALADSGNWNGTDSLDFSKYVRFDIHSLNGKAIKRYIAQINIHQLHPDSMSWSLQANNMTGKNMQDQKVIVRNGIYRMYVKNSDGYELYQSSNTLNWTKTGLTGLNEGTCLLSQIVDYEGILYVPTDKGQLYMSANGTEWTLLEGSSDVKALLGVVCASDRLNRPSALAAVIKDQDKWHYAAMDKEQTWKTGAEIAEDFPLSGFSQISHEVMYYQRLMVLAGKDRNGRLSNVTWETMDGLAWIRLTDERASHFDKREGAALTKYDDCFYFFGGIDASNKARKDIYRSESNGLTWELVDTLITFPDAYKARGYSSVHINEDKFILLFGGKESTAANIFDELWAGRINRLGFKD